MLKNLFNKSFIVLFALFSLVLLTGCTLFDGPGNTQTSDEGVNLSDMVEESVMVKVTDQEGNELTEEVPLSQGESVYELLNKLAVNSDTMVIQFESFDFNNEPAFFVSSINGYNPTADNAFWAFYVNGEMSPVGISDSYPSDGDEISFRVEAIQ